uniref:MD-2-related lipid-recognition domain-containing protein n=1 Tax=Acrobeloides nanus TaxID=290746 RepID=A0A914ENL6_9BILA
MSDDSTDYDCSVFPNQTYFRPHFFSCHNDEAPPKLVVHDSAVANATGDYHYPLDFTQHVRFFFDVTSFANRRYDNMRAEVYLYKRRTGWLGCGWLFLPTFGIIDNYDVCDDNLSCPVYPGRQVIEIVIRPKIIFSGIFKMIHNKKTPYQLVIRLVNNRKPTEELMCVVYQSKIDF